jgi:glycosyltransferase involved in cell wall biosynthesis
MSRPIVHVLLATYNGERHLSQQWASLEAQQGVDLVVHIADDGSTDGTVALMQDLAARAGGSVREVHWLRAAPRRSATKSFLLLLEQALQQFPEAAWFAFCDQDDVWLPTKLAAAVESIAEESRHMPALYGGRTLSVDENDHLLGLSPLFRRPPCFRNALVQSILGGNTMVMNRPAALLVAHSARNEVTAHDWFSYQIVTGAGGTIFYDPEPHVRYRQHGGNVVGSNIGWRARFRRLRRMVRGDFGRWNALHVAALQAQADHLVPAHRAVLEAFARARVARNPLERLVWLRRSGVFRQTLVDQLALYAACLLQRL